MYQKEFYQHIKYVRIQHGHSMLDFINGDFKVCNHITTFDDHGFGFYFIQGF